MAFTNFPITTADSALTGAQGVAALQKAHDMPSAADVTASKAETDRFKEIKPAAIVATHAAAISLAENLMRVGELVQTIEYDTGTKRGSRINELKDAGSSGARPSPVEGLIYHVTGGSGGLYLESTYMTEEVIPWSLSSVNLALIVARALGQPLKLSYGVFLLSEKLVLQSNDTLLITKTASLTATVALSGSTMIEVGTTTVIADNVLIGGGGSINAAGEANRAIDAVHSRFSDVENLSIDGAVISLIRVGSSSASGATYEFNISKIRGMNEQAENHPSSIGIYYANATDCYLTNCVPVGYRKGVEVGSNAYSIEMSKVHPWGREVHGAMTRGFSILGTASLEQCNADTPFDLIGIGGDLYGYYISGNVSGGNCRVFSNNDIGSDVNMDGRTIPFYFDGNNEAYISIGKVHGGSATRRFKSFDGGDTTNNGVVTKISGPSANYVTAP